MKFFQSTSFITHSTVCVHKIMEGNIFINVIYILLTISLMRVCSIYKVSLGGCSSVNQRPMTQGHMSNKTILPLHD